MTEAVGTGMAPSVEASAGTETVAPSVETVPSVEKQPEPAVEMSDPSVEMVPSVDKAETIGAAIAESATAGVEKEVETQQTEETEASVAAEGAHDGGRVGKLPASVEKQPAVETSEPSVQMAGRPAEGSVEAAVEAAVEASVEEQAATDARRTKKLSNIRTPKSR